MSALVFTDGGIDDLLALALALRTNPPAAIATLAGNVSLEHATSNTLYLLDVLDVEIPVVPTSAAPLKHELTTCYHVHGPHGMGSLAPPPRRPAGTGGAKLPASTSLVSLGPLTAIASLENEEKLLADLLSEVVVMGGCLRTRGNTTEAAEYNFYVDPDAVQQFFNRFSGFKLVSLDVTETVVHDQELRPETGHQAYDELIVELSRYYLGKSLHDPIAIGAVVWPELFEFEELRLAPDPRSRGRIVESPIGTTVRFCTRVAGDEFKRRLYSTLMGQTP